MGFSPVVKGNHSHVVLLDTTLHGDAVTDASKLPWHRYLKDSSSNQPSLKPFRFIVCSFEQHEICMAGPCKIAVTKLTERHGTGMYKLCGV